MLGTKKLQPVIERGTEAVKSATSSLMLTVIAVIATFLVSVLTLIVTVRRG